MLYTYKNGNYIVSISNTTGTKKRFIEKGVCIADFPESIDLKITNKCDVGCWYCHESSIENGKHADIDKLISFLDENIKVKGIELAIGGGDPFTHPDLEKLLKFNKQKGIISNITINGYHINRYIDRIKSYKKDNLLKGIGVSYTGELIEDVPNVVYHIIAGVDKELPNADVLILGYKRYGRAENTFIPSDPDILKPQIMSSNHIVSFDNLAIKQLDVKNMFGQETFNKYYMGDDGKYTMYIDAVNWEYSKSSTSKRKPINNKDLKTIFKEV